MDNFGKRLKAERQQRGMTINDMAKKLKLSHETISQSELGKNKPSERTIKRVVITLGWRDGVYADYYYGISKEDAAELVRRVESKVAKLDATQSDVAQVLGTTDRTYRQWLRNITPKNKRTFLEFVEMDEKTYQRRLLGYNDQHEQRFDNPFSKEDLRKHRLQRGLTLAKLAEKLNVNPTTPGKWERGVQAIPATRIRQLYKVFDLPYYEVKRVSKTTEQREKERKERVEIYGVLDRKTESWSKLPDDDIDLIRLRKVMNI